MAEKTQANGKKDSDVSDADLAFWIDNNRNVLFIGRHGVGKTAKILEAFGKKGWILNKDYLYFSASTMDPWTDLIGIPKEGVHTMPCPNVPGEVLEIPHLKFIRPLSLELGTIRAIVVDEFNRAPKKVKNALMELIQFKSINGKRFENLEIVWAAINPEDDENDNYDVEPLDAAQKDRFHICRTIKFQCDIRYFKQRFGNDTAFAAIKWWNSLDKDGSQLEVSPRRLVYAIEEYRLGGNVSDVLPRCVNSKQLEDALKETPANVTLRELIDKKDVEGVRVHIANENHFEDCKREICEIDPIKKFVAPLLSEDKVSFLMDTNRKFRRYILDNINDFSEIVQEKYHAAQDDSRKKEYREALDKLLPSMRVDTIKGFELNPNAAPPHGKKKKDFDVAEMIQKIRDNYDLSASPPRQRAYAELAMNIPLDMTPDQSKLCLLLLNELAMQTHPKILGKWIDLIGVINNCVLSICGDDAKDFPIVFNTYKTVLAWGFNNEKFCYNEEKIAEPTSGAGVKKNVKTKKKVETDLATAE